MDVAVVDSPKTPGQTEKAWERSLRPMLLPLAVALLIAISLFATFTAGERRGMDHVVTAGPGDDQRAIAVALSDVVYKLNLGYIGYTKVLKTLQSVWDQGAPNGNGPIVWQNDKNRTLLNLAIHAAASLGPQKTGYLSDFSLFTMYYEDLGYVDYVKYAFRLFGPKIESMYYLFFVLVGLSALAFLITFRSDPIALALLFATVFAFLIEIYINNFWLGAPTFVCNRHGSVLGLLPMWYFILLTIRRSRPSLINVALAIAQLVLLLLAIKLRGSTTWMVVFVIATTLFCALWPWLHKPQATRSWPELACSFCRWPALLLLGGLFANAQYMNATLHPAYFTDDAVPYHTLWHSVFLGWAYGPEGGNDELLSPYLKMIIAGGINHGDTVGVFAAVEFLRDSHFMASDPNSADVPPDLRSPWSYNGDMKYRLYDAIMRRVVMRLVWRHPIAVLRVLLVGNPTQLFRVVGEVIAHASSNIWIFLVLIGGLVTAAIQALTGDTPRATEVRKTIILVACALPFAALVNLVTFAVPYAIPDLVLSLLIFLQIACWSIATMLIGRFRHSAFAINAQIKSMDTRLAEPAGG